MAEDSEKSPSKPLSDISININTQEITGLKETWLYEDSEERTSKRLSDISINI